MIVIPNRSYILAPAVVVWLCSAATIPQKDCVERSLCYHSTDCCSGCCDENQCVAAANFTTVAACADFAVPRTCSSLACPDKQQCSQEMRFCLIAPCPQPLPECVAKSKTTPPADPVPLPVKY